MPNTITTPTYRWPDGTDAIAIFSNDANRRHRYLIEKIWRRDRPMLMFVMSHSSTATEAINDDTVEICEQFAKLPKNEFGGIYVTNIFAFVQREAGRYETVNDQIGTENDRIIREYARTAQTTILCAWGDRCVDDRFPDRLNNIESMLREEVTLREDEGTLYCFEIADSGNPKQPLELIRDVGDVDDLILNEWRR